VAAGAVSEATPLSLPHSVFPGAVFPAVAQTQAAAMLAVQFQLMQSERLAPEALRALQFRQIGELVAHIDRCVPHYGLSLRRAGIQPGRPITPEAWSRVPILTRKDVKAAGPSLFAREVPRGHGRVGAATTSGSSGRPVSIRKTELAQFYWQCYTLREEIWHRRDLSAKLMSIRRDDTLKPGDPTGRLRREADWGAPLAGVYPTGPAVLLDYRCSVQEQAETLERERPAYLVTFPSLLLALLRCGVRPEGLREVRTVGEALSAETRAICRERWGVPVTDVYSAAETGAIALQCPGHDHYHVQSESVLVEVLRDDGTPCAPGETGQVVLTPLHNFAMPLLRYAIDDRAEIGPPCPCGRTLPVLSRIPGRARGLLALPNGGRRFPYYGHNALMRVEAIVQHQVVQRSLDEVEIGVVLRRPLTADEERHLIESAERALGPPFRVTLVVRDAIERGPSGKYAEFYSEVDP
jgi:phenylacetate-CoA ligase